MSAKPELFYWDGRGRAEIVRLTLAAADIEFSEPMFLSDAPDIAKLRSDGCLAFGQLPLLKWDGLNLVQTGAILRYIANRCGLYGVDAKDKYEIDMLFEGTRDFNATFLRFHFMPVEEILHSLRSTILPKYMPVFEKHVTTGDFLVGGKLSFADVGLLEVLLNVEEKVPESFVTYPKLKAYLANLKRVPQVDKYLNGPQRKRPNDEKYVTEVKRTLGW